MQFYKPFVLKDVINLKIRSYRFIRFDNNAKPPTSEYVNMIVDNDFPGGLSTFLPESIFIMFRRYTRGNTGRTLAEAFHGVLFN